MNNSLLITVLVLVCLGAYGIYTSLRIQKLLHISRELVQSATPYQRFVSAQAPNILFIGDSTGVGVGADTPLDSLAGRFGKDHPEWTIDNLSVSGRKTAELIPLLQSLPDQRYEKIIVQIGANDIVAFSDTQQLKQDIASVLREATRAGKTVMLLTSGNVGNAPLFPRPFGYLWKIRTLTVRDMFQKTAQQYGVTYIDLYRDDRDDPFVTDPYHYHARDLFHPSSAGYGEWYHALQKT